VPSRAVRPRRVATIAVLGLLTGSCGLIGGCGTGTTVSRPQRQNFLNSVYGQAPDIGSYRTSIQLVSMGQAVCADLSSGASVQEVADRMPLVEGSTELPATDLGVVIYSAVRVFCPRFDRLLNQ
jgi:Protein of unknown function (DUF732)